MSNLEQIQVDDLLVLGNAVPDELSDNRKSVCTAGYSKKYGLIRIYPVPPIAPMNRWNIVSIPLEKNPKDTREESWKVQGSKAEWDKLHNKIKVLGQVSDREEKMAILENLRNKYGAGCIERVNEKKGSLAIIEPNILSCEIVARDDYEPSTQLTLESKEKFLTIKNYPVQPRITYRCIDCKTKNPHNQQVVEWGIYEWIRQNPKEKWAEVWKNLHIGEENYYTSFLVGNQAQYRNAFLIISIFRLKLPKA